MVRAAQASPDSGFGDFRVWLRGCGLVEVWCFACGGVRVCREKYVRTGAQVARWCIILFHVYMLALRSEFKTIKDCLAWASFACLFLYFLVFVSHTRVSTTHSTRRTVLVTRLGGYRSLGWSSSPPPPPLGDNVAVRSTGITIPQPGVGPH